MPLQIRRGTDAERVTITPVEGELIYTTDDQRLYVGDGTTVGGIQITGYTNEDAQDTVNSMFQAGSHVGISFDYNDAGNAISAEVDLSTYTGTVSGSAFKGSIFADDSTLLVNAVDGTFNMDGTIKGHIVPDQDEVYDLGSASNKFRDLYLSGSSIKLGASTITAIGPAVNLPVGSTVNGNPILTGPDAGNKLVGDLQGSVFGQDSSIIVDGIDNVINISTIIAPSATLNIGEAANPTKLSVTSDQVVISEVNGVTDGTQTAFFDINVVGGTLTSPVATTSTSFGSLGGIRIQGFDGAGDRPTAALIGARNGEDPNPASDNPAADIFFFGGNNNTGAEPFSQWVMRSNGIFGSSSYQFAYTSNGVDPLQNDKPVPTPTPANALFGTMYLDGDTETIQMYVGDSDGQGTPGYTSFQGRDPIAKTYTDSTRPVQASFTASIADDSTEPTLTVSSVSAGYLRVGMPVSGSGVAAGTTILEQRDGVQGGAGNYRLNISQTVGSTAMTGPAVTAGTMIFNSTSGEFQGWDGSAWVTLG